MLDELTKEYLNSLTGRIESIKTLIGEYRDGDKEAAQKIRTLAHSLYGSGATYGFPEISEASREVEHAPEADLIKNLTILVKVLKDVLARSSPAPANDNRMKILIIDDDPDSSELIKSSISKSGSYNVVIAESAAKGMDLLLRQRFALVILDLVLPDRDGREILRDIKFEFKIKTAVLVLSGIDKDVVRIECMSLGADKVLVKPFNPDSLAAEIDKLLRKGDSDKLSLVPIDSEKSEKTAAAPAPGGPKIELEGKSVLLAEDDVTQANLIKQRLMREGLAVKHVDNGKAAIEELQKKDYSLLILDVQMPLLDGFGVLKRVRGEMNMKKLPIIMLTAMGSEQDIIRGYDLGASDYILKPFSTVQLIARAKSLLK